MLKSLFVLMVSINSFALDKVVCDSVTGTQNIRFEIVRSPFSITYYKQDHDDSQKWNSHPYWDDTYRCGHLIDQDELKSTTCDLNDDSSDQFLNLKFGCFNNGSKPTDKYVWGEIAVQVPAQKGILNCVSRHFELKNCH